MKLPLRFIIPLVSAILIIIACVIYLNTDFTLNKGENDITYKGVVYERANLHYNISHTETSSKKIGSYGQIYAYGQEYIYDVYQLNDELNVLYTPHATFVKQGYPSPSLFGEDIGSIEYVVSEGRDLKGMPDNYSETATPLDSFENSVRLEDIIETEPSTVTITDEQAKECDEIRMRYKNHADLYMVFYIYGTGGEYYIGIIYDYDFENYLAKHQWYKIKPEYVDLLTSAMPKAQ